MYEQLWNKGHTATGTIKKFNTLPQSLLSVRESIASKKSSVGKLVPQKRKRKAAETFHCEPCDRTLNVSSRTTHVKSNTHLANVEASKLVQLDKGEWVGISKEDSPVDLVVWNDSALVFGISTSKDAFDDSLVRRRVKGSSEKLVRYCPELISSYNKYMGAIDAANALRSHVTTSRRCKKWWHSIMYFLLDVSAANGYIVWKQLNPEKVKKMSRYEFMDSMISWLLEDTQMRPRAAHKHVSLGKNQLPRNRLDGKRHFQAKTPDADRSKGQKEAVRGRCVWCFKTKKNRKGEPLESKTRFYCMNCPEAPWVHPECMEALHTDLVT